MDNIRTYANDLMEFFHQRYKLQNKPKLVFAQDEQNSLNPLGKTAHYEPGAQTITVFITGRHIKDCLRSLAHELVHHKQFERGDMDNLAPTTPGYAQEDGEMRELEREAYQEGNLCFRDWEDGLKQRNSTNYLAEGKKGDYKMSYKDWRNTEFNSMLMEKWGYKKADEPNNLIKEEVDAKVDFKSDYETAEAVLEGDAEKCGDCDMPEGLCECGAAMEETVYNVGRLDETKLRTVINKLIRKLV